MPPRWGGDSARRHGFAPCPRTQSRVDPRINGLADRVNRAFAPEKGCLEHRRFLTPYCSSLWCRLVLVVHVSRDFSNLHKVVHKRWAAACDYPVKEGDSWLNKGVSNRAYS